MHSKFSSPLQKLLPHLGGNKPADPSVGVQGFWQTLGGEMDPSAVVALREHLNFGLDSDHPPLDRPISASSTTWQQARSGFKRLSSEMNQRFVGFKDKWKQRWQLGFLSQQLIQNQMVEQGPKGWKYKARKTQRDSHNLSKVLIHEMLKDLEKELIFVEARLKALQDLILRDWYAHALHAPEDRILPTLESSLRPAETHFMRQTRDQFYDLCDQSFQLRLRKMGAKEYPDLGVLLQKSGLLALGSLPAPYLNDTVDFARSMCMEWLDWHLSKWSLFLRGCLIHPNTDNT